MQSVNIHVISFDVPYPPDYGGVIDVYYKLKNLSEKGIGITLHCFQYGRSESPVLNSICKNVFYYPRKSRKSLLFNSSPYIVLTRDSDELKSRLLKDNNAILMEGLHSTSLLNDPAFLHRTMIVRTHNVEHDYYSNLASVERNIFKKTYFTNEASKLQKYEAVLSRASSIAAISPSDTAHYLKSFRNVHYIPAFHPYNSIALSSGKSDFAFYHGNLSVGENNEAALYLVRKVFNDLKIKLVIAGNKPSRELKYAVQNCKNITLHDNLDHHQIEVLISEAQCNILPTFQSTGIKLKLLAALFTGRTCIVNSAMVLNTGLESLCRIADDPDSMKMEVKNAMKNGVSDSEINMRHEILPVAFSNSANADKLIHLLKINQSQTEGL